MKINELEKMLGLSKANIRFYESEGLITPKRTENGYRDYSADDVKLLKKIIVYRKLGISISEIKAVLNREKALNEAVVSSINNMKRNIESQNVAIEICEEIRDKNVADCDFDTDYFWEEINSREEKGERFVEFGNIDITSFKNTKGIKILLSVFVALFFMGIAYSFFCDSAFIINNNENYKAILPEIETADTIDTVKVDDENGLIYVFYDEASCINTYDFDGNFKWAVSVPYCDDRGMTYFYLENNRIYIDNKGEVYIYNSLNGEYLGKDYAEELGLIYKRDLYDELHNTDLKNTEADRISFDIYNVYLLNDKDEIKDYVVYKPISVMLKNDIFGFFIAVIGGIGIAVVYFINKIKLLNQIKLIREEIGKAAKIQHHFYVALLISYIIFGMCNVLLSVFDLVNISVGIFPSAFLLMISLVINDITKKNYNDSEIKYVGSILHYLIIAFAILLISVIIFL
ncbi:MAG: MerR family transcriptional regulator [Eubacterium sp.]